MSQHCSQPWVASDALRLRVSDAFIALNGFNVSARMILKLEGFCATGSIKMMPAIAMINNLEARGLLIPGVSTVIESSSGNLGVALATVCRLRGYRFVCVVDPNATRSCIAAMQALAGKIMMVEEPDPDGGFLKARLDLIASLLEKNPEWIWTNQYANQANIDSHSQWTAVELLAHIPNMTDLYIGTGTTGTVAGVSRVMRCERPDVRIVAVEPEGSVTFSGKPGRRRFIPGIGTSRRPAIADENDFDYVHYVDEIDSIDACHALARTNALLLGGSTGSVVAAMLADAGRFSSDSVVVGISPDNGDKYLDTVYDPNWVMDHYGRAPLNKLEHEQEMQMRVGVLS